MIALIRSNKEFPIISILMVLVIAIISIIRQEAAASMLSSRIVGTSEVNVSQDDLKTVQKFLESQIVMQKLRDFGMSKEEALAKVSELDREDLHTLASMIHTAPAGGDGLGILIGVAVLAILVIIIVKLLNKEIIIK